MRGGTGEMEGDVSHNWPWTWSERAHGWFTANGITRYGPLPKREVNQETWPPQRLERNQHTSAIGRATTPQAIRAEAAKEEAS